MQKTLCACHVCFNSGVWCYRATAQQAPMMQPQAQTQQPQQERPVQGAQIPRRSFEEDDTGITGWHHGPGWSRYGGHMGGNSLTAECPNILVH